MSSRDTRLPTSAEWVKELAGKIPQGSLSASNPEVLPGVPLPPVALFPAADRIVAALSVWVDEGNFPRIGSLMPDSESETFGAAVKSYNVRAQAAERSAPGPVSPHPEPRAYGNARHWAEFGWLVLQVLESEAEWGAGTLDRFASEAVDRGLAYTGTNGEFRRAAIPIFVDHLAVVGAAASASNEKARQLRGPAVPEGYPALMITHDGAEVVAVDIARDAGDVASRRELVRDGGGGDFSLSVLPLLLVLKAGELLAALRRLMNRPDVQMESTERETDLALYQAECATSGLAE